MTIKESTFIGMLFQGWFPVDITMPCGQTVSIHSSAEMAFDRPCPCGDPNHWIVKWEPAAKKGKIKLLEVKSCSASAHKITAIHSGSDWADAHADYVILPNGTTIEKEVAAWDRWYRDVYTMSLRLKQHVKYKTLAELILERGGRVPNDDELEIFDD